MTFYELLTQHTWNDIHRTLFSLYPDETESIPDYMQAFAELKGNLPRTGSSMTICIETVDSDNESYENYENVYALEADDTERYGLDFVSWAEVLSMSIEEEAFEKYTQREIICHILFEITFHGYSSEAVVQKGNEVKASVQDILRELGE